MNSPCVSQQDKYRFEYVRDARQSSVARVVPRGFKGRRDDFFKDANVRLAAATGFSDKLDEELTSVGAESSLQSK